MTIGVTAFIAGDCAADRVRAVATNRTRAADPQHRCRVGHRCGSVRNYQKPFFIERIR